MPVGRPPKTDTGTLYFFANDFYWTLRRLNEGHFRWKYDEEEYKQLAAEIDSEKDPLDDVQRLAIIRCVTEEINDGRLKEGDRERRLRELKRDNIAVTRDWLHNMASDHSRKRVPVPGKPEVLKALLDAQTPGEIGHICESAFIRKPFEIGGVTKEGMFPNWPIPIGSMLPTYLSEYSIEFIAAKKDKRFPASGRPSSELKQLWFLSRALAGAIFGIKSRTAINLLGSIRPEQTLKASRNAKLARKRKKD